MKNSKIFKPNILNSVPNCCVRFVRCCGKLYSRHPFLFLLRRIGPGADRHTNFDRWLIFFFILDTELLLQENMAANADGAEYSNTGHPNRLDLFLTELAETKAKFPDDENAHIIREELNRIVLDTVVDLSGKYRVFYNAVIQQGGSIVEGTKIGQPDEFDYVVVLPALQEQLVTPRGGEAFYAEDYNINYQTTKLPLKLKELLFLDDILCPDWFDKEENESRRRNQLIFKDGKSKWRDEIAAMVSVAISRSLEATLVKFQKWKYVTRLKQPSGRTYLQVLKFTNSDGLEIFVSVRLLGHPDSSQAG